MVFLLAETCSLGLPIYINGFRHQAGENGLALFFSDGSASNVEQFFRSKFVHIFFPTLLQILFLGGWPIFIN